MNKAKIVICVLFGLTFLGTVGCGRSYEGDKRYEISGAATFNGQPIVEGTIDMTPIDHDGHAVSGMIEDGQYAFAEEDGPNLGMYRVEVYGFQSVGDAAETAEDAEAAEAKMRQVVPPKYNKATTLEIEVVDGENIHDFNLAP